MGGNSAIRIQLEQFDGPLDLLLHLIQSHEMDVSKVSISKVTEAYLSYVQLMQDFDFDLVSEYLVMAATLILWKSKALLPVEAQHSLQEAGLEDAPLTPEELVRRLLEHQRYLAAGSDLDQLPKLHEDFFVRTPTKLPREKILRELSVTDLALSYQEWLARSRQKNTVLKKETVSVDDKVSVFNSMLEIGKMTALRNLIRDEANLSDWVATFLASLELARIKKLEILQSETYAPIYIRLLETIGTLKLDLALSGETKNELTAN